MQRWISKQVELQSKQFEKQMEQFYPESKAYLHDAPSYHKRIDDECNFVEAAKIVDWESILVENTEVLDLGAGSGWLSALLSKYSQVKNIKLIDSSEYFLQQMMPEIVNIMNGDISKTEPIIGHFSPLLLPDESVDLVVSSSSLHHSDDLEGLLREIHRILKKGRYLAIINETPSTYSRYCLQLLKRSFIFWKDTFLKNYKRYSPNISSKGILHDPYLNDMMYPMWYWKEAIKRAGFSLESVVNTGLPTVKDAKGVALVHYICRKP